MVPQAHSLVRLRTHIFFPHCVCHHLTHAAHRQIGCNGASHRDGGFFLEPEMSVPPQSGQPRGTWGV